jgi:hypothetical protein
LNEERDSVAEEKQAVVEKISSLKEEMFDRIGNLEKIGLNLVADTHFSPNVEEYIERISLLKARLPPSKANCGSARRDRADTFGPWGAPGSDCPFGAGVEGCQGSRGNPEREAGRG